MDSGRGGTRSPWLPRRRPLRSPSQRVKERQRGASAKKKDELRDSEAVTAALSWGAFILLTLKGAPRAVLTWLT